MGVSSNTLLAKTQVQRRYPLDRRDTAIAATENRAQSTHLNQVHKTRHSNTWEKHALGCELLHISVEGGQLTI